MPFDLSRLPLNQLPPVFVFLALSGLSFLLIKRTFDTLGEDKSNWLSALGAWFMFCCINIAVFVWLKSVITLPEIEWMIQHRKVHPNLDLSSTGITFGCECWGIALIGQLIHDRIRFFRSIGLAIVVPLVVVGQVINVAVLTLLMGLSGFFLAKTLDPRIAQVIAAGIGVLWYAAGFSIRPVLESLAESTPSEPTSFGTSSSGSQSSGIPSFFPTFSSPAIPSSYSSPSTSPPSYTPPAIPSHTPTPNSSSSGYGISYGPSASSGNSNAPNNYS